jgi:hypothetical protein
MTAPTRYSRELIEKTKEVWNPQLGREITDEEAEEIIYRWSQYLRLIEKSIESPDASTSIVNKPMLEIEQKFE